jgi:metal-dependent hydrolase (beta-lactamase superfamily II)
MRALLVENAGSSVNEGNSLNRRHKKPKNTDFFAEKGLSLHLQRDDDSILFDTGVTGKFVDNANKLGISLEDVGVTAISHGHFDQAPFYC